VQLKGNPKEGSSVGRTIKYKLSGNESSIVEGKPLFERADKTREVFDQLLEANSLPVARRINGEKMSEAEHEATITDIMDGIPSQRAENYLNSLEKQIAEDAFDFANPDPNIPLPKLNEILGVGKETDFEKMTPEKVDEWLSKESELTPEETEVFDNIENLITYYEQRNDTEGGTKTKVSEPTERAAAEDSGKTNVDESAKTKTEPTESTETSGERVKKETEGGEVPPKEPTSAEAEKEDLPTKKKRLLNRLVDAKFVSEESKSQMKKEGLDYIPKSQKEAEQLAKEIIDSEGIDEAVQLAKANEFGGDVNTLIQTESLNRLKELEDKATTPEEKKSYATKFAELGIELDKWLRKKGQSISALNFFYKKSPLGIELMERAKRKEDFEKWSKPKEKSWKEYFEELMKEPEFESILKERVSAGMKEERAAARKERIEKVDKFFDDAINQFKGGATYSTIIPPKVITTALEGMKKAYRAGEAVAKIIQDAIDYISKEIGNDKWDKEKFRKDWEAKLADK